MEYALEIVKKDQQQISRWAGGVTTQLAIYPKAASVSEKNFSWRLSTAEVEVEESTFTVFPGKWRHLMVLEGELRLEHEGHHSSHLLPYQQDSFSGDWITRAVGRVTDFNLMLTEGWYGKLEAVVVEGEASVPLTIESFDKADVTTQAFYCTEGSIEIAIEEGDKAVLETGDALILNSENSEQEILCKLINRSRTASRVVRAIIFQMKGVL